MTVQRLVVVGASLAGLRAVEGARRAGHDGPIMLIGAEPHLPYDRPPLSKAFLDGGQPAAPPLRTERALREELGVELVLGVTATGLDTAGRTVLAGGLRYPYDALVLATGSKARRLPGTEHLSGVHTLRTVDDATAIRAALDAGARVVVVGAGFIGSEVASAARKRGLDVTVVELLATPLVHAVGELVGGLCADLHLRAGTDLRCGVGVQAVLGTGAVQGVLLSDGTELPADLVVLGTGAVPATEWLAGSGLTVDNGVLCDETLCAGVPGVYAAGDLARWRHPVFGRHLRVEHWTNAAEQGMLAGRNAADPAAARPYAAVPYFWSDCYGSRIQFLGVPAADEVRLVGGDPDAGRFLALYREGERLSGAFGLNAPAEVMRYRALIARGAPWREALDLAQPRQAG